MAFRSLRNLIRPLAAARATTISSSATTIATFSPPLRPSSFISTRSMHLEYLPSLAPRPFDPLTDSRPRKRRPSDTNRRKRSTLRPPGPISWVRVAPWEAMPAKQPNEGSVKLRNEKKRRRLKREFIKSEAKKRKVQIQEAKRRKREQQIAGKMAAVAREREWAQRLAELQRLEEEKKKAAA